MIDHVHILESEYTSRTLVSDRVETTVCIPTTGTVISGSILTHTAIDICWDICYCTLPTLQQSQIDILSHTPFVNSAIR